VSRVPLRHNRDFVLLQLGQGFSTLGSTSTYVAYPLLVLALTHSPAKAGVVGFANVLPYALWLWAHAYLRTSALIFAGGNFVFSGIYLVFVVVSKRHGSRPRRSVR
jgi:hypothetical protein